MSVQERIARAQGALPRRHEGIIRRREVVRAVKQGVLERIGFAEVAHIVMTQSIEEVRTELRPAVEAVLNAQTSSMEALPAGAVERDAVVSEVLDDMAGLGPLQPLLEDDTVSEIMVNGCGATFFERAGVLHPLGRLFESDEQIRILIDRIIAPLGRRIDERSPIVNARLKSGYRVNAVIPPIAIDGPVLTIRKFSDRITSLEELVRLGSLPAWYAQLLSFAVWLRQDLAVAGGTGSGKTTLLNALSCEIPTSERIVTIEDSAELKFSRHPHVVRLEARAASIEGEGAVTIRDLVTNALRMRPDRIIVGECRGAEALDMLQAMNTGHDGSLTTLHANSPEDMVMRLVTMVRYGLDLPVDVIESNIASALDLVIQTARFRDGRRFVTQIAQVENGGGDVPCKVVPLFEQRGLDVSGSWDRAPEWLDAAVESKAIAREEVDAWMRDCF